MMKIKIRNKSLTIIASCALEANKPLHSWREQFYDNLQEVTHKIKCNENMIVAGDSNAIVNNIIPGIKQNF